MKYKMCLKGDEGDMREWTAYFFLEPLKRAHYVSVEAN